VKRLLSATLLLAACSTPASRIKNDRAAFDAAPPAIQEKLRAGQVDVGMTPEQARIALGKPDRVLTRRSAGGKEQEVWLYFSGDSGVGLGVGGIWGGPFYSGVSIGASDYGRTLRAQVIFEDGRVVSYDLPKG
jgi:hypothetical protein